MADVLFKLREAGVASDVIQKLQSNKKAMEVFTQCDALLKEAASKKVDAEGVPLPPATQGNTAAASSTLKWQKSQDGKWVGGKDASNKCLGEKSQCEEGRGLPQKEASNQSTRAENSDSGSPKMSALDDSKSKQEKQIVKTQNVGVSWMILALVSVLVACAAVAGTVFFHKPKASSTDLSDAIAKIECPVTECPTTECPKCQNLVPETILTNVRNLEAELKEMKSRRAEVAKCPECPVSDCPTAPAPSPADWVIPN